MKKLIFLLFASLSLQVGAQIKRPIPGRIVYNNVPTLLQTIYVKFNDIYPRSNIPNYNNILDDGTSGAVVLKDISGIDTEIRIDLLGDPWYYETEYYYPMNDIDFVGTAMEGLVYTEVNKSKTIRIKNLITNNRRYKFTFLTYQSSGGDENITKVTLNGITQTIGGYNRSVGKTTITIDNLSTATLDALILPVNPIGGYGCLNALKIEIYSN